MLGSTKIQASVIRDSTGGGIQSDFCSIADHRQIFEIGLEEERPLSPDAVTLGGRSDWTTFERETLYSSWDALLDGPRISPYWRVAVPARATSGKTDTAKRSPAYFSFDYFSASYVSTAVSTATTVPPLTADLQPFSIARSLRHQVQRKVYRLSILGHPVLRQRATPVAVVDDDIRRFVDDLLETMYNFEGVGLAANQVGIAKRVAVVDIGEAGTEPLVLINPRITQSSHDVETSEEGCLSIPEIFADVERPFSVTVEALDYYGKRFKRTVSGYEARAVQHEIDHLDGILFLDRLSATKRNLLMATWKKLRKGESGYTREPPDNG